MFFKATLVVVLALFGFSSAQVIGRGACPSGVQVVDDFDVERYLGTWYEYARYPNLFQGDGICNTAVYTPLPDGTVGVNNTQVDPLTGEVDGIVGSAKLVENGKLLVTFPGQPQYTTKSNYWVLGTDYDSYAVVYACSGTRLGHGTYAWILTRERQPAVATVQTAENVFTRNNLRVQDFIETDQSNCY